MIESSLVTTLIIATWKSLLRQKEYVEERPIATRKSMSRHCMKKFCHDNVMNVATLKDKVSGPDRETKSRQVMLT